MKHFYLLAAALMLSAPLANGQVNLHITQQASSLTSTATHFMVDVSKPTENTFSFALFTDDISDSGANFAFIQLLHEHKFWEKPIYLHSEFRSYNLDSQVFYAGAAFDFFSDHGMVAIEPLARYGTFENAASAQLSVITGHDWGWCNLNSFTDIWYGGPAIRGWYSEAWLYFPICSWAQLGGVGCFSWDFAQAPMLGLYLGVKFNLL